MIRIDFDHVYELAGVSQDLSRTSFLSPQIDGTFRELLVIVRPHPDTSFAKVYNMAFGPPDGTGGILDRVRLKHQDVSMVFSTVLFHGLNFLKRHPKRIVGIDGSDDSRATLYHQVINWNKGYLESFFRIIGVDWYVRVFRNGTLELDNDGYLLSRPKPEFFDFQRDRHNLYRYYMFQL